MHDRNVQPVEYQRAEASPSMRRAMRWMIVLTLLNTVMLGISLFGPRAWPYFNSIYQNWKDERAKEAAAKVQLQKDIAAQKQSLTFNLPKDSVVYEEDWDQAVKLLATGPNYAPALPSDPNRPPGYQVPVLQSNPQVYKDLTVRLNGGGPRYPSAMAFLHELKTPSGKPMLVAVELTSLFWFKDNTVAKGRRLWASAWETSPTGIVVPTKFTYSMELLLPDSDPIPTAQRGNTFRLFAGEVDPKDSTRFIIPFEVDGKKGEIVGQLTEDAFTLTPNMGTATFGSGDLMRWKLLAKPSK
jgi:hypothetical protein